MPPPAARAATPPARASSPQARRSTTSARGSFGPPRGSVGSAVSARGRPIEDSWWRRSSSMRDTSRLDTVSSRAKMRHVPGNLMCGDLIPVAAARVERFDMPPPRPSRIADSRIEAHEGHVSGAPAATSRRRAQRAHLTGAPSVLPDVVYTGGKASAHEYTSPVPLSKRHVQPPPAREPSPRGLARSNSPARRTTLTVGSLVPEPNPSPARAPPPERAHERPSRNMPRRLPHYRRCGSHEPREVDAIGVRIESPVRTGLARVAEPSHDGRIRRKRWIDPDVAPTERQLGALRITNEHHSPAAAPPESRGRSRGVRPCRGPADCGGGLLMLTQNELLPPKERALVASQQSSRRQSPMRGASNRCSSPNILAWD